MSSTILYPDGFSRAVPEGDDHERMVCGDCGFVSYENPKIITGSVVTYDDKILLCKRAIDPQKGRWTIPAGFMELNESPEEGAVREAWEEARAKIIINDLLAVYTVRRISQVHLMFRAELPDAVFEAGPESERVALFTWNEIPWDDLAFPSVHWVLKHHQQVIGKTDFPPFTNPAGWEAV